MLNNSREKSYNSMSLGLKNSLRSTGDACPVKNTNKVHVAPPVVKTVLTMSFKKTYSSIALMLNSSLEKQEVMCKT